MSDPYNNQYPPPNGYGSPAPQQPGYQQPPYPPQPNYQQPYNPGQPQGYYGTPDPYQQNQGHYGPPAHGGFQHGQQAPAPYQDPSQQYNQGQYAPQYPNPAPSNQYPQQGPYPNNQYPQDHQAPPNPYGQPQHGQNYGATDPGAQQEGDRGLMGALGGGAAGYFGGKKVGNHGLIGALAGAVLGSKLEDKHKNKKHGGYGGYH